MSEKIRVLHFVTGGFSGGATQVAIKLVRASIEDKQTDSILVLRRKRYTDPNRITELQRDGLAVKTVPGWSHLATIAALWRICKDYRPDILVAHGFSEHLWGRYAGLLAKVPSLVHVEHNSRERYTWWRLAQARWLAKRTARIVGCSEGGRNSLLNLGFDQHRTIAIDNGSALTPFIDAELSDVLKRDKSILMVARFGKQKDHITLIRALDELRKRGLTPKLEL
ncbi:MAG: glycosyltransferase, partial [Steroidobacteraceae bacterium]